ncbi:MAG: 2-succinyl-5-enolpyruvyl-6-hydroxy-3-cyclohexene-1-carboxylic-acid synthase [Candidatus Eiseniibacteriota bacterium]
MADLISKRRADGEASMRVGAAPAAGAATAAANLAAAERFVASLAAHGVRDACICSGSRSAPLALAFHRSGLQTHVPLDERAGAFFALGLAKASRRPVAIVTTSGTAAANLYPAIIESSYSRVPLIALTADRPPELRDAGAPQTIDQIKMFGDAVRWFHEVGTPAADVDWLQYVTSLGARAVAEAWGPPAGPVHLNFAFREPLVPEPDALVSPSPAPAGLPGLDRIEDEGPELPQPSARMIARTAAILRRCRRGLIVCGPEDVSPRFPAAVAQLAEATGYPILADPGSQVRYGAHDRSRVIGAYDAFLRAPSFASGDGPEVILQFGPALTSKSFHLYAARYPGALHLIVDPGRGWRDPSRRASDVLAADPVSLAQALADALSRGSEPLPEWGERFARADRAAREALERHRVSLRGLNEASLFAGLLDAAPEGTLLYVGNSLAIRNLDLFQPESPKRFRVLANRGANGIDGLISSGLGASAGTASPTLVVTGDLSFHHDLNGLAAVREGRAKATIVVIHNDGGGIFNLLPIAHYDEVFERYFGTPHGIDFASAAAMYGIPYARPASAEELRARVSASLSQRGVEIIEVRCDRAETRELHLEAREAVARAVEEAR